MNEKTNHFLRWFQELDDDDQSDAIDLVYDEFKVRGMVEGVSGLSPEQRNELFGRLGIPKSVQEKLFES